jgi:hypothetical protein
MVTVLSCLLSFRSASDNSFSGCSSGYSSLALLEGSGWLPRGTLASGADFTVEIVNLFKRETLGLVDEEVDEGNAQEAASEPDEEDLTLEVGISVTVVDKIWC